MTHGKEVMVTLEDYKSDLPKNVRGKFFLQSSKKVVEIFLSGSKQWTD